MTCLMFPRAELSWQPVAAAADGFASVRAPAPCTATTVASAAIATAARIARFLTCPPLVETFPVAGACARLEHEGAAMRLLDGDDLVTGRHNPRGRAAPKKRPASERTKP